MNSEQITGERPLASPLANDDDALRPADVVIIGGGATGLSAAWWLARDVVDVAVLIRLTSADASACIVGGPCGALRYAT